MQPRARLLVGNGPSFTFDAGSISMELLVSGGPEAYRKWEVWHTPQDLADWLGVDEVRLEADDVDRFKDLRDTLWSVIPAVVEGRPVSPAAIETINGYARDAPRPHLDPASLSLSWSYTASAILGAFARDALELIGDPARRSRLRECSGHNCKLLFLDTSRPGNRRWCSMERCGNRNKVRSHRARRSGE
ncbi:CGNR zinc finger domain-containing protein [Actinoplanes sp. NPDC051633]|uniref:CGNR zinc finger domain-containing protein n=1 Tax=Actinoplanes sp. NPDC051633 TaxID=3155670 RepID=UPI00342FAFF4